MAQGGGAAPGGVIDLAKIDKMCSEDIDQMITAKRVELNDAINVRGVISSEIYQKEVELGELKETKRKGGVEISNLRMLIDVLKSKFWSARNEGS